MFSIGLLSISYTEKWIKAPLPVSENAWIHGRIPHALAKKKTSGRPRQTRQVFTE